MKRLGNIDDLDACLRCGKCCHYIVKNVAVACPFLVINRHSIYCSIYPSRLGTVIAPGMVCRERKNVPYDFPGCPYNTSKPLFPLGQVDAKSISQKDRP